MKTTYNVSSDLFDQLGLASGETSIAQFVDAHQLSRMVKIDDATFWKPHQIGFLISAKSNNSG